MSKAETPEADRGYYAEYDAKTGLLHIAHLDGEVYIAPERVIEVGVAETEDEETTLCCYLMVDGSEDQLDVPAVELEQLVDAWVTARKKHA